MNSSAEHESSSIDSLDEDDRILVEQGYKPSFKREFSNLATVRLCYFLLSFP